METPLLHDPQKYPVKEMLKNILGNSYSSYEKLTEKITGDKYELTPEWRFYKDGKSWLCKVCHKKKTIFWLSVWDQYFRVTFYFTEKTGLGISELEIKEDLKEKITTSKPIGKLIPLTIIIKEEDQIEDVLRIAEFKKKLK